ncbi:MAG: hypothetical protein GTO24_01785 [candidate division Zixibacteria bacterium]|nr:hypothetical protein [candidate division Zixibacteria bacterium]
MFGIARGLDPSMFFISLLYDAPDCAERGEFLGPWLVSPVGLGVLAVTIDDMEQLVDAASISILQPPDSKVLACGTVEFFDFDQTRIRR